MSASNDTSGACSSISQSSLAEVAEKVFLKIESVREDCSISRAFMSCLTRSLHLQSSSKSRVAAGSGSLDGCGRTPFSTTSQSPSFLRVILIINDQAPKFSSSVMSSCRDGVLAVAIGAFFSLGEPPRWHYFKP